MDFPPRYVYISTLCFKDIIFFSLFETVIYNICGHVKHLNNNLIRISLVNLLQIGNMYFNSTYSFNEVPKLQELNRIKDKWLKSYALLIFLFYTFLYIFKKISQPHLFSNVGSPN